MTRWSLGILFGAALVLAYVEGEWHGRQTGEDHRQELWRESESFRLQLREAQSVSVCTHWTFTGTRGGSVDVCTPLKGPEPCVYCDERAAPEPSSLWDRVTETSRDGVNWFDCDLPPCLGDRFRRMRTTDANGSVTLSPIEDTHLETVFEDHDWLCAHSKVYRRSKCPHWQPPTQAWSASGGIIRRWW